MVGKKHTLDRHNLISLYIRCTPQSLDNLNIGSNQITFDIPREDSAIALKDSYPESKPDVTHKDVGQFLNVHGTQIRLVSLNSPFGKFMLTNWWGKIENIENAHIVCFVYK